MLEFEAVTSVRAHAQWLKTFNGQVNKHILDNPPLSFRPSIFHRLSQSKLVLGEGD